MSPTTLAAAVAAIVSLNPLSLGQFIEDGIDVISTQLGTQDREQLGFAPALIGDLNGDGVGEVVYGSTGWVNDSGTVSACVVVDGASGEMMRRHPSPDGQTVFMKSSDAGDMDGDGVIDYAVGGWSTGVPGKVIVYSGADGSMLMTLTGQSNNDQFGLGLASLDDVNGDGFDDLVVGAPFSRNGNQRRGRVALYSGMDGSEIWAREGASLQDAMGQSCFAVDDLDGDGVLDVGVASPQMRPAFSSTGPGFVDLLSGVDGSSIGDALVSPSGTGVFFGGWLPSPMIDLNGDGVHEILIADQFDGALGASTGKLFIYDGATRELMREMTGSSALQGLGASGNAGDLDLDGVDDLIVSSWRSPDGAPGLTGKLEIFSGASFESLGTMTSTSPGANFGGWLLSMGDVPVFGIGDGFPDFFVNAPSDSTNGVRTGQFWVISGKSFYPCRADFAKPYGVLNGADVLLFAASLGAMDVTADINRDGAVNFFDIYAFLMQYFAGCP
jgi:FG-GAP repeat